MDSHTCADLRRGLSNPDDHPMHTTEKNIRRGRFSLNQLCRKFYQSVSKHSKLFEANDTEIRNPFF